MNYDPNFMMSGSTATQQVELVFGSWEYRITYTAFVKGNFRGYDAIEQAVEQVYQDLGGDDGEIVMTNAEGDTLTSELWEHDLREMLIESRIVAIEPITR